MIIVYKLKVSLLNIKTNIILMITPPLVFDIKFKLKD